LCSTGSVGVCVGVFFFSSRRRHTRWPRDWSSDVCSSDLDLVGGVDFLAAARRLDALAAQDLADEVIPAAGLRRVGQAIDAGWPRSEERRVGKEWRARWWTDE